MQGIHHFKNMPHYRLEGPLGKRRWHYIGPEEKKPSDSHHYFSVEEALKQITPHHILDGFDPLGGGSNGVALAFESPFGPLVVKNAYPVRQKLLGQTGSDRAFWALNDEVMHGLGMELPELDEFVQRSKAILGATALPTVYVAWDVGEIDQKLNELKKGAPLMEGLDPQKKERGIAAAHKLLVEAWKDQGVAPIQISLRVGDVPGYQFTEAKGVAVRNILKENLKQKLAEGVVGATDRHPDNYLKIADSKGRALMVGMDYAWISDPKPFLPHSRWLYSPMWPIYEAAKGGNDAAYERIKRWAETFWDWGEKGSAPQRQATFEIAARLPYLEKVLRTSPRSLGLGKNPGLEKWFDAIRETAPRWAPNLDWTKV